MFWRTTAKRILWPPIWRDIFIPRPDSSDNGSLNNDDVSMLPCIKSLPCPCHNGGYKAVRLCTIFVTRIRWIGAKHSHYMMSLLCPVLIVRFTLGFDVRTSSTRARRKWLSQEMSRFSERIRAKTWNNDLMKQQIIWPPVRGGALMSSDAV